MAFPNLLGLILVLLSVADGGATLMEIKLGIVTEANPIMNWCMGIGNVFFLVVKIGLTTFGALYLVHIAKNVKSTENQQCAALVLLVFGGLMYFVVCLYHVKILGNAL